MKVIHGVIKELGAGVTRQDEKGPLMHEMTYILFEDGTKLDKVAFDNNVSNAIAIGSDVSIAISTKTGKNNCWLIGSAKRKDGLVHRMDIPESSRFAGAIGLGGIPFGFLGLAIGFFVGAGLDNDDAMIPIMLVAAAVCAIYGMAQVYKQFDSIDYEFEAD